MRYAPAESLTADLTFSIRTSLEASTVTPGIAAPEPSLTTPTIVLWAWAALDRSITPANAKSVLVILRAMLFPSNANRENSGRSARPFQTALLGAIGG